MCGVVGCVNWGNQDALRQMTALQAHRGPDDEGLWEKRCPDGTWIGLGSRRLAILDLSPAGHMPMSSPCGRFTIVYNGELYNYPELRERLERKGFVFRSNSDTEVALYMYEVYGSECVTHFNGIFAIVLWDDDRQQLFIARDHFGVKPLYYVERDGKLAVASEMKSLLRLPGLTRRLDIEALHQYMTFLWVPDPLTILEGIYKLPAGHYGTYRNGKLTIEQYWDLHYPEAGHAFNEDETSIALELRQRLKATVKAQMLSDVPVGAFLSAGLDSSTIVALMAQASARPVKTFTVAFPPAYRLGEISLDDPDVARRTAERFGCDHTELMVEPEVTDLLPRLVWHMDEPTADPAIIMAYLVNRAASRDATVLLSGVGGDELFAGYRKYRAHFLARRYRTIPYPLRRHIIEPAFAALPAMRGTRVKGHVRLAKKMARSGSLPAQDRFIMDSVYLSEQEKSGLYREAVSREVRALDPLLRHREHFGRVTHADFLNQMLYVDTKAFMTSLNLAYNDKMSMAASVEVRVPFLDWQLAEWVAQHVSPQLKLRNGSTKYILRRAMEPILPREVLAQKKAGFGAPVDYWLAHDLQEMVNDLLGPAALDRRGLFRPDGVHQLIEEQRDGRRDWSLQIWQLLTLELWLRTFIDDA